MTNKKLERYHIDVYVPDWGRDSILECIKNLGEKKIRYSRHANKKLYELSQYRKGKKITKAIKRTVDSLDFTEEYLLDYVFEFYCNSERMVKKLCYRIPLVNLKVDFVLVLSNLGKVVTIYTNNDYDKHRALDITIYDNEKEQEAVQ